MRGNDHITELKAFCIIYREWTIDSIMEADNQMTGIYCLPVVTILMEAKIKWHQFLF